MSLSAIGPRGQYVLPHKNRDGGAPSDKPAPVPPSAPTPAKPSKPSKPMGPSALQRHVQFFDGNADRKITYSETKKGLEDLGVSKLVSWAGALFINLGLAPQIAGKLTTTIDMNNIHKAKHAADTGTYDEKGNFVSERFKRVKTFDANNSQSLSWAEMKTLMAANGKDFVGRIAAFGEFKLLHGLANDTTETEDGKKVKAVSFERLSQLYDGTLFYRLTNRPLPDWGQK